MKYPLVILVVFSWVAGAAVRGPGATFTEDRALEMNWGKMTVLGLAVSPDGSKVAAVAASPANDEPAGRLVIFDFKTGTAETQLETDTRLEQVAFAKSGELVTRAQDVRIWNVKTKQPTRTISENDTGGPLRAMALSPDGKKLAIAAKSAKPVTLWDLAGGEGKALWEEKEAEEVASLPFDAKGERLAVGGYLGNLGRVYDVRSGKLVAELKERGVTVMRDVVMSQDGYCVAAATPGAVLDDNGDGLIYNVFTGRLCSVLKSLRSSVRPLGLSPDGLTLLAAHTRPVGPGFTKERNILAFYLMYGGLFYAEYHAPGPIEAGGFVDGSTIVVAMKDAKGISRISVLKMIIAPEFKATYNLSRKHWIDDYAH